MENNFYTKRSTKVILRYIFLPIFIILNLVVAKVNAQVDVSGTTPVSGPTTYTTLKLAFDAINSGAHKGAVTVNITANTTETASAVLNASGGSSSYTSVTITPTGGGARTISGAIATNLIDFNGADNVTIDGLNSGGNSLKISNTSGGSSSAIRFINDATNNTITRCNLEGSASTATTVTSGVLTAAFGVVYFGTGIASGNDGNNINNCDIGPAGANTPVNGIVSIGSSNTVTNSGNIINANKIHDYYHATSPTCGILLGALAAASTASSSQWTISNNRLYQSATRIYTAAAPTNFHSGILTSGGEGFTVTGNVIGYADALGNGTTNMVGVTSGALGGTFPSSYTLGTAVANPITYRAISLVTANPGATSSVQGNTIGGFAMFTSSNASTSPYATGTNTRGVFCGLSLSTGAYDCGNLNPNIIGSTTGTGSIYVVSTTTGATITGIYCAIANATGFAGNIQNNTIGGLDAMGATNLVCGGITGIFFTNGIGYQIFNNTIGNSTNPNLRMGTLTTGANLSNIGTTFGVTSGDAEFNGIYNQSTGAAATIRIGAKNLGNTIQNAAINSTNPLSFFKGINCSRVVATAATSQYGRVTANTVRNITSMCSSVSFINGERGDFAGCGIYWGRVNVGGGIPTFIEENIISELSLTNTGTGGYHLGGIVNGGAQFQSINIIKNKICNLRVGGSYDRDSVPGKASGPGIAVGIYINNSNGGFIETLSNNMISLGNGETNNTAFIGIFAAPTVASLLNVYHNTIDIEGTASGATKQSSFGFYRYGVGNPFTVDIRNNILSNTRTGGTGKHYCISDNFGAANDAWGTNASDYNILNGNASTIGYFSGDQTFAGWKTASASDEHSFSAVAVTFLNPPCDLHINMGVTQNYIESQAVAGTGTLDDIDDQLRPGPAGSVNGGGAGPDIGADEFDGSPIPPPVISNVTVPTGNGCGAISHVISANVIPGTGTLTSVTLNYNNRGAGSVAMTFVSGTTYTATIPAAAYATDVTWKIVAVNSFGLRTTYNGTTYKDIIAPPTPVATTNLNICAGLAIPIPPGSGLTATCSPTYNTQSVTLSLTNVVADEGSCPGTLIGSFVIPPARSGSYITKAKLTVNGITFADPAEAGSEIRLSFSGPGIIGGGPTPCYSGVATGNSPIVVNWVTGKGLVAGDSLTFPVLVNPAGGTINISYSESFNDVLTGPDANFPSTATFTFTDSLPPLDVNWYDLAVGGTLENTGTPFNPIVCCDPNSPGVYNHYARCIISGTGCESAVGQVATLSIGQPLTVTATQSLSGSVCSGTPNQLGTTITGGGEPYAYSWSPSAGLSDPTIANPIATPSTTTTYTVTVTDNCGIIRRSSLSETVIQSPSLTVLPSAISVCRATTGAVPLTASGTSVSYTWSPSDGLSATTGPSVNAYPLVTTTYVVTGTGANGCTSTGSVVLTTDTTPNISVVATPSSVCLGQNSTLSVDRVPVYCVPTHTLASQGFTSVIFNTLTSSPPYPAAQPGYHINAPTGNNTTTLTAGNTYLLTVNTSAGVAYTTSVWIDYNRNGVFDDNEWHQIYVGNDNGAVSIQIPLTAENGTTRMRLRAINFPNPSDSTSACFNYIRGSSEDYTITIVGGAPASPYAAYSWSPATYLNSTTLASPTAVNVNSTVVYTVTVTNAVGCTQSSSVTMTGGVLTAAPTATEVVTYCPNTNNGGFAGTPAVSTTYISNVTFDAINANSAWAGQSVTSTPNPSLVGGNTYAFSVSTIGDLGVAIWIDYNYNGQFEESELVYDAYTGVIDQIYTGNITIPTSAFNGTTRIRIRALQFYDPVVLQPVGAACFGFVGHNPSGAGLFDNGETEDYLITITNATVHFAPCSGAVFQLEANASAGGAPYTYSWAPTTGLNNPTFSSPTATVNATTIYTVTVTDICGSIKKSTVLAQLDAVPVTAVSPNPGAICTSGSVTLTASGAFTYTWAPSTGLNTTVGASVIASPTETTYYVVTGNKTGCTNSVQVAVVFNGPLPLSPTASAAAGCTPFSTQLFAGIPTSRLVFSEVTLNRDGVGATSPYPFYIPTLPPNADFVEITNTTNASIDVSGYLFDDYLTTTNVSNHPYILPPGTIIPANGVLVLHLGAGTNNPANNYFNTGGTTDQYLTTDQVGFVLKDGLGNVVDAVGVGTGYSFNALTGVTASDWAGATPPATGAAGVIRTASADNNIGGDWTLAGAVRDQNLGTSNPGILSITSYSWSPATNLSSTTVANPTVTNLTSTTTYTVSVTNSFGCTAVSSITLSVNPVPTAPSITPGGSTTFCPGGSVTLTASSANAIPAYTWAPATGLSSTIGTSVVASPVTTTIYTVTVTIPGGCTATSTITINVNTANTPVITTGGFPTTFCQSGSVTLNASAPGPYTGYVWSVGTSQVGLSSTYLATTSGLYVVTVTAPNTCTTTASVLVTVNPNPAPPTITLVGTLPICDNATGSVLLDANVGPGYTFEWNDFNVATTEDFTVYGNDITFAASGNPFYSFNLTITDVNGCKAVSNSILVTTVSCGATLNLKMYIQGFYSGGGLMQLGGSGCLNVIDPGTYPDPDDVDDITVTAMDPVTYLPVESQVGRLKTNGDCNVIFTGAASAGSSYYLRLTHRNLVETWSKDPVLFQSTFSYDFTTASTQAYDDGFNSPMKLVSAVPQRWACFNGDIDQDGGVTSLDMTLEEIDSNGGAFGYNATDLNGDGGSDSLDMTIIENNGNLGVFTAHP